MIDKDMDYIIDKLKLIGFTDTQAKALYHIIVIVAGNVVISSHKR